LVGGSVAGDYHVTSVGLNDLRLACRRLTERHVDDVIVGLVGARAIHVATA